VAKHEADIGMQEHHDVDMRLNVPVPMHDGVNLSADLYLPRAAGPFPTVLMRTPYSNNTDDMIRKGRALANRGYACVIQDTRGRWDSQGEYNPFFDEAHDGYETQEWVGHQPWSNGKVGMSGASYVAAVQWLSAPLQSEFLTCIVPRVMCTDYFADLLFPGGAMQLNVAITWGMRTRGRTAQSIDSHNWTELFRTLPLIDLAEKVGDDVSFWRDWVNHPTDDDYWQPLKLTNRFDEVTVPVLEMSGCQ
jgi:putative CocE/NonD family hydrolase